jgi:hypothetical protein
MPAGGVAVACLACRDQFFSGVVPRGSYEDRRCALEILTGTDSRQHPTFATLDALSKLFLLVIFSKTVIVIAD